MLACHIWFSSRSLHTIFNREFELSVVMLRSFNSQISSSTLVRKMYAFARMPKRTALDATFGRFSDPRFFMQLRDLGFLQPPTIIVQVTAHCGIADDTLDLCNYCRMSFQQVRLGEGQRAQQPGSSFETVAARTPAKATRAVPVSDYSAALSRRRRRRVAP